MWPCTFFFWQELNGQANVITVYYNILLCNLKHNYVDVEAKVQIISRRIIRKKKRSAEAQSVTVNATGCGFHSPLKDIKY